MLIIMYVHPLWHLNKNNKIIHIDTIEHLIILAVTINEHTLYNHLFLCQVETTKI